MARSVKFKSQIQQRHDTILQYMTFLNSIFFVSSETIWPAVNGHDAIITRKNIHRSSKSRRVPQNTRANDAPYFGAGPLRPARFDRKRLERNPGSRSNFDRLGLFDFGGPGSARNEKRETIGWLLIPPPEITRPITWFLPQNGATNMRGSQTFAIWAIPIYPLSYYLSALGSI